MGTWRRGAVAALLVGAGIIGSGCPKPDPLADCRATCRKVADCGLTHLVAALDCANDCKTLRTFSECPGCLAGSSANCEAISTARVCGASCRVR